MRKNAYQIVYLVAIGIVVLFYVYDYHYLNLSPITRYCFGISFILIALISTIIIKARLDQSSRFMTAKNWGNVISYDDIHLIFERNNTYFIWEPIFKGHKITFSLVRNEEKFSIRQQDWKMQNNILTSDIPEIDFSDCQIVSTPNVSGQFVLLSKNVELLQKLLNVQNVIDNLDKYIDRKILITFNEGKFEMCWESGSNEETEDFKEICQTGIIFQEEMSKLL